MAEKKREELRAIGRAEAIQRGLALSASGRAKHRERIEAPWGTVRDWSILVSLAAAGYQETGSEFDNAPLTFEVGATPADETGWRVTARYRFRSANSDDPQYVRDYDSEALYLMVLR
jgi:hypothetical protein